MSNKNPVNWAEWLNRFVTEYRQEVVTPLSGSELVFGTSRLTDSPEFTAQWLSFIAESAPGQFDSWEQFQHRFTLDETTPRKPVDEAPAKALFKVNSKAYLERRTTYEVLHQRYREALRDHQHRQTEIDRFKGHYGNTPQGYVAYVDATQEGRLRPFLEQPQTIPIQEVHRERHTYVSGGSGAGKSEMLKSIIYHYLTAARDSAIIVLDPHGTFADEIARFPEAQRRLVYINPVLSLTDSPRMNPFDIEELPEIELDIHRQQILAALGAILGDQAALTPQMKSVLSPCVSVLLKTPGAHIGHLKDFLGDETIAKRFVERSLDLVTNPEGPRLLRN